MKIALKDFKKQFLCFFKMYRGGPNFNKSQHISYKLENYKVSLLLPVCNPPKPPRAKIVNYPMSEPGWFEKQHRFIAHRKYIPVFESYWYYWPLIPTPLRGELGDLRLNLVIEQLPENAKLPMTTVEFAEQLLNTHNDYYNSEIVGDYLLGRNTEIKNAVEEQSASLASPWSEKEKNEIFELRIKDRGHPVITEYQIMEIGGNDWVHYIEGNSNNQYIFSMILTNGFYLTAKFTLDTNMSSADAPWYKDAEKARARMMSAITVEYIPDEELADESHSEEALLNKTSGQNLLAAK